ncbi:MAG: SpvB/TcaC N-terminal domain-containing protein [Rhizomicrobium sp.]
MGAARPLVRIAKCGVLVVAAQIYILASAQAADTAPAMIVPGQFNVSPTGGATYTIPISVPPGTAGMVPALSLDYSSQNGDGIEGWQWALNGLPTIGRCPQTWAQDAGVHGGVNYNSSDRFCLEGQRLVLISGTYGAPG